MLRAGDPARWQGRSGDTGDAPLLEAMGCHGAAACFVPGWGQGEARRALEVPTAALGPSSQLPGLERLPPANLCPQQQALVSQWE